MLNTYVVYLYLVLSIALGQYVDIRNSLRKGFTLMSKLYKYIASGDLNKVFSDITKCGFKCSYPKDYNDPFELFLTIDYRSSPERLAFYQELINKVPQKPTTCFSRSPIVPPMWAHYGETSSGFVIEIDEERLKESNDRINLNDVDYRNEPNPKLNLSFDFAYGRRKPRDIYFFLQSIMHSAYFTKATLWSYESERRLVLEDEEVDDNLIFTFPSSCVTAIISGPMAKDNLVEYAKMLCIDLGCNFYSASIGKTNPTFHFFNPQGLTYKFDGSSINLSPNNCNNCKEPIESDKENLCSWCAITDEHRYEASINPFRMMHDVGILDGYLDGVGKIRK